MSCRGRHRGRVRGAAADLGQRPLPVGLHARHLPPRRREHRPQPAGASSAGRQQQLTPDPAPSRPGLPGPSRGLGTRPLSFTLHLTKGAP